MRLLCLLPIVLAASACTVAPTAYRAHYTTEAEVVEHRACAARCDERSALGEDLRQCLARCPGFDATRGQRCDPSREKPGTYCVTVETRVAPDAEQLALIARVGVAAAKASNALRPEQSEDANDHGSSAEPPRGSNPAPRAHVRAKPSRERERPARARRP
ncbi:MAG: hypothetical protein IT377_27745 [Polyangiaceae bacterium]|nr:hypothetical protein [Polyangiaceae bacterium]